MASDPNSPIFGFDTGFGSSGDNSTNNSGVGQAPNITKITLSSVGKSASGFGTTGGGTSSSAGAVTFYLSPEIEESGSTNYIVVDDIRAPASILVWMGSPSRTFNINAQLLSRTVVEAQQNWKDLNLLRAWRMPLGSGIAQSAVPEVITLNGYGFQFSSIPTVVKSLNITFPTDVDYITTSGFSIPILMPVSIQLQEYHTINELQEFNYDSYKSGQLGGWN